MTDKQHERRRDARVTFLTFAKLSYPQGRTFDKCETKDVSVSGVFVEGVTGVERGEKCDVEFHLSGRTSSLVLKVAGETVRVQEDGVALQFFDVDEDSFYHLKNLVYFNYKKSGGADEVVVDADDVDEESLYLGLDKGDKKSLPDDYLDEVEEEVVDESDDDDVYEHYKGKVDEDDLDF